RLGLPPVDAAAFEELVAEALAAAGEPDCFVRLYFTPGREGRADPASFVLAQSLPPDLEELRARGLRLAALPFGLETPSLIGGVKSTSYALNMVAVDEAR